jgi:hypothetical protein
MNNQDKEHLEAVYAGLAMAGYLMNGDYHPAEIPTLAKAMAKLMMEESDEGEAGLALVRKRVVRKTK